MTFAAHSIRALGLKRHMELYGANYDKFCELADNPLARIEDIHREIKKPNGKPFTRSTIEKWYARRQEERGSSHE